VHDLGLEVLVLDRRAAGVMQARRVRVVGDRDEALARELQRVELLEAEDLREARCRRTCFESAVDPAVTGYVRR